MGPDAAGKSEASAARDAGSYAMLLGNDRAQMVITDPPYNVPVNGHVCGLGKVQHREFAMASGEMTEAEFVGFLSEVCGQLAAFSVDGSIHFVCMDWRHMREMLTAGYAAYPLGPGTATGREQRRGCAGSAGPLARPPPCTGACPQPQPGYGYDRDRVGLASASLCVTVRLGRAPGSPRRAPAAT